MNVLIIGGNSAVGRSLKPVLAEFCNVLTAGRQDCNVYVDLNKDAEEIVLPDGMDVVINAAARFGGATDRDIYETENTNVLGTLKICQACARARAKHFLLISSIFSTRPNTIYALSKKHAEEIAEFYCASVSLPLTILRPTQLYGSQDDFRRHQPFFYTITDKAQNGEDIFFYGTNDAKRNYLHIDDLNQIIARVVRNKTEGKFSCLNSVDISYSRIAKAAYAAFNTKGEIKFLSDKPNIPDNVFEGDNVLYERIGFYPRISIEEGLKMLAKKRLSGQ